MNAIHMPICRYNFPVNSCKTYNLPGQEARFFEPHGLALDYNNCVVVVDMGNHCIRRCWPQAEFNPLRVDASHLKWQVRE
eukprot:935622-Prorocentrum_minimum.AAC.1